MAAMQLNYIANASIPSVSGRTIPVIDPSALVEPDRVHRRVYTDPAVFDAEMERIVDRAAGVVA